MLDGSDPATIGHKFMKTVTDNERLIKPADASLLLAVSRRTLRRYEDSGQLQAVKLNQRAIRYRLAEIMRLMGKEVAT